MRPGRLPGRSGRHGGADVFGAKGTGVMTHVRGPRETIFLAGAPLDTIMFWVPPSGRLGLGMSFVSYAGQVWLGVATDKGLVPDPEGIIAAFYTEFEALMLAREKEATEERTSSVDAMNALLNGAIRQVTTMTEGRGLRHKAKANATSDRCQAMTQAGRRCKNRALADSGLCRIHHRQGRSTTP